MTTNTAMSLSLLAHGDHHELHDLRLFIEDRVVHESDPLVPLVPLLSSRRANTARLDHGPWVEWIATASAEEALDSWVWLNAWEWVGHEAQSLASMFPRLTLILSVASLAADPLATSVLAVDGRYQGWTTTTPTDAVPCIAVVSPDGRVQALSSTGSCESDRQVSSPLLEMAEELFASGVEEVLVSCPFGIEATLAEAMDRAGWQLLPAAEPLEDDVREGSVLFSVSAAEGS